jgi:hypothetical protein
MSLSGDARRLTKVDVFYRASDDPQFPERYCIFCMEIEPNHDKPCPALALPKIVAALEAAERLLDGRLPPSRQVISLPDNVRLVSAEARHALWDALKGEEAPA